MDKVKVDLAAFSTAIGNEVIGYIDGAPILANNMIPYEEKTKFALELAQMTIVLDEEAGIAYKSYLYDAILAYLFIKYYTNIDVSNIETEEDRAALYDCFVANGMDVHAQEASCYADVLIVEKMYGSVYVAVKQAFETTHSLGHQVKTSFASVLTGEDITETLAKSQDVSGRMMELFDAFREKETKPDRVNIGGKIINMAKKKNTAN